MNHQCPALGRLDAGVCRDTVEAVRDVAVKDSGIRLEDGLVTVKGKEPVVGDGEDADGLCFEGNHKVRAIQSLLGHGRRDGGGVDGFGGFRDECAFRGLVVRDAGAVYRVWTRPVAVNVWTNAGTGRARRAGSL